MKRLPALISVVTAALAVGVISLSPTTEVTAEANDLPGYVAVEPPPIPDGQPMVHIRELARIAKANGGNRAHGTSGHKATVDYVRGVLDGAGFVTNRQSFKHLSTEGWNIIAEWPHGDADHQVFLGAHLDSVRAGAGINDDSSGIAALLENALAVAKADLRPDKRMVFGFWGAEEVGLTGSKEYVRRLSAADRERIDVYLNFDMVGTKNPRHWGVYKEGPEYAAMFTKWFEAKGVTTRVIDPKGRSDHASFADAGITVSGISSESDLANLEPCYHKACDGEDNVSPASIGLAGNAIASVSWRLAGAKARR